MQKSYYIYTHRRNTDSEIFYIGKVCHDKRKTVGGFTFKLLEKK